MSRLEDELASNPKEKIRGLLAKDFKLISDSDLTLYLKAAEKWLMDNINQSQTDEYSFIESIWQKISQESKKREKETNNPNEFTESDQRFISNELFNS